MKGLKLGLTLMGAAVLGVGVAMTITNPGQNAYEDYATEKLTELLNAEGAAACEEEVPDFLTDVFGENMCEDLLGQVLNGGQGVIRQIVSNNTERENYWIFSIYKTDLSSPDLLADQIPSYEFETVGAFQNFFTYKADQQ